MTEVTNPNDRSVFVCVVGPGYDSTSPTFVRSRGSTPRPRRRLTVFIHNSVSFNRKPQLTTSKNDPHLEELTISIAMDNTALLITNVYIPTANSCNGRYSPPIDHLLIGTDSLLQCSPFTLALRNNRYERQSTGGFNQYFQHGSHKYRFTHKTPW